MTKPNNKSTPCLILDDKTKFYLATQDVTSENTEFFHIASLYLPLDNGMIKMAPITEVASFDKPESAIIYRESIECLCKINSASKIYKDAQSIVAEKISNFKQR